MDYTLTDSDLTAFKTALGADDSAAMLRSVEHAARANQWPNFYRPSFRVGSLDPAWMAATGGKVECFIALTQFMFADQTWLSSIQKHRDGRNSRFPMDVAEFVKVRLAQLAGRPDAQTVLTGELSRCFLGYLSQPGGDIEPLASDLELRAPASLAEALGHAKGKRLSEIEQQELDAVVATVSNAVRRSARSL